MTRAATMEQHRAEIAAAAQAYNTALEHAKSDGYDIVTNLSGNNGQIYSVKITASVPIRPAAPPPKG